MPNHHTTNHILQLVHAKQQHSTRCTYSNRQLCWKGKPRVTSCMLVLAFQRQFEGVSTLSYPEQAMAQLTHGSLDTLGWDNR